MSERVAADEAGCVRAAEVIRAGGVVALPTDTFYGLAADVHDEAALARLLALKGRPAGKPLPVLVADLAAAEALAGGLSEAARRLADRWWPGPLMLVLRAAPGLPEARTGGTGTVGLRVADHSVVAAVLARVGGPITGTSANRAGEAAPRTAEEVEAGLGDGMDLVLDGGGTPGGAPSTVVDCTGGEGRVVRAGGSQSR